MASKIVADVFGTLGQQDHICCSQAMKCRNRRSLLVYSALTADMDQLSSPIAYRRPPAINDASVEFVSCTSRRYVDQTDKECTELLYRMSTSSGRLASSASKQTRHLQHPLEQEHSITDSTANPLRS